jgi:arylsulfatase A-like enzyme
MSNKSNKNIGVDLKGKNIVLIVADTLTALHLPTYGYDRNTAPFLADLAENNTYFQNAYSNAPWTVPSHASMFTGKLPSEHGCNTGNVVFDRHSFVQDLSEEGYNTVGISANELISEQLNFDSGFNSFHEVFNFESSNSSVLWKVALEEMKDLDLKTIQKGLKFLYNKFAGGSNMGAESIEKIAKEEIKSENSPNFLFINYTEPHLPYNSPKEFAGQFTDNPEEKISRNMKDHYNTEKPEIYYQGFPNCTDEELVDLYDGTIKYLDSKIERLYEYLNAELDDLVFIVTSDHGENFGEHGAYFHQCGIWEKSIRIPMIIAGDGVENQKIEENYSLRNLKHMILKNEVKTTPTVFAEYAGGKKMGRLKNEDKEEIQDDEKRKYSYNKSKCIVGKNKAIVRNSELENFQFVPGEKCYSENRDCFENQEKLEKKLELILGD